MTCVSKSKIALSLMVLVGCLGLSTEASAGPLAIWNFNDASNGVNSAANTLALFSADGGTLQSTATMSSTFNATSIIAFTGTTTNSQGGDLSGQALALQGGPNGAGTTVTNNGQSLTFGVSTVGQSAIMVSLAIQRTSTGFNGDQFQYSLDGSNFVNFQSPFVPVSSFTSPAGSGLVSFDLSSITGLNNDANALFRIVFNGATSGAGNNRLDNLVISGTPATVVPEPASLALLGTGLVLMIVKARRRRVA